MALYLTRFSQPAETWTKLIENPEDRRGPVGELAESVVLVSTEEMMEALEKAKSVKYQPPGG